MKKTPARARQSAFTLIELLVVIAIIAILAAILFPVFAQARAKARQTACLSNTKQIANAVSMYAQDYDESLPMVYNLGNPPEIRWWTDVLQTYTKNYGVFMCPEVPDYGLVHYNTSNGYGSGGYGWNYNLGGTVSSTGVVFAAKTLAEITDSAGTFCVTDGAQLDSTTNNVMTSPDNLLPENWNKYAVNSTSYQVYPPSGWNPTDTSKSTTKWYTTNTAAAATANYARRPVPRHNGGLNVVYCDGHAKWNNIKTFLGVTPSIPAGWPYGDPNNSWDDK